MKYEKNESFSGGWVKGADVESGTKCSLTTETKRVQSQFKDKNGNPKTQDVAKIQFFGTNEAKNISINRASLNALVDAFGTESNDWVGKELTAQTEKVIVGGKRVTAVYLVPNGYEMKENDDGFVEIVKEGKENGLPEVQLDEGEEVESPF